MKGSKGEIVVCISDGERSYFLCDRMELAEAWAGFVSLFLKTVEVAKVRAKDILFIEYF